MVSTLGPVLVHTAVQSKPHLTLIVPAVLFDSKGWLCQIKLSNPADFETLLTAEAYQKICEN